MAVMFGNKPTMLMLVLLLISTINGQSVQRLSLRGDQVGPIVGAEGYTFDFRCTAQTFNENHYIIWYRRSGYTQNETEIYRNRTLQTTDLGKEALAYSLNNSTEAEFTITITTGLGQFIHGNGYRCQVIDINTSNVLFQTRNGAYVMLHLFYPPPAPYPLCSATSYQNESIAQNVSLSCTTLPGNPISIQWWRDEVMVDSKDVTYDSDRRFTEYSLDYNFTLQQQDLEATYECRVTWGNTDMTCMVQETSQLTTKAATESPSVKTTDEQTTYTTIQHPAASNITTAMNDSTPQSLATVGNTIRLQSNTTSLPLTTDTTVQYTTMSNKSTSMDVPSSSVTMTSTTVQQAATTTTRSEQTQKILTSPTIDQTNSMSEDAMFSEKSLAIGLSFGAASLFLIICVIIIALYKRHSLNQMPNNIDHTLRAGNELTEICNKDEPIDDNEEINNAIENNEEKVEIACNNDPVEKDLISMTRKQRNRQ